MKSINCARNPSFFLINFHGWLQAKTTIFFFFFFTKCERSNFIHILTKRCISQSCSLKAKLKSCNCSNLSYENRLVWVWYAVFAYIWNASTPQPCYPTHRAAYTRQSPFCVSIPRVFVFIWRTIYTYFHEIGSYSWWCQPVYQCQYSVA